MAEGWETEWSALDRRTRGRLRRAALWGREASDPREAALVAAFARSKAKERRGLQIVGHVLLIVGMTAALILDLSRHGGRLAPLYAWLLVFDLWLLAVFLSSRGRLLLAAERNEHIAEHGR